MEQSCPEILLPSTKESTSLILFLRPVSFKLVCLCTVMQNESSRNARADVWTPDWPPQLIFAGANLGRETGSHRWPQFHAKQDGVPNGA